MVTHSTVPGASVPSPPSASNTVSKDAGQAELARQIADPEVLVSQQLPLGPVRLEQDRPPRARADASRHGSGTPRNAAR